MTASSRLGACIAALSLGLTGLLAPPAAAAPVVPAAAAPEDTPLTYPGVDDWTELLVDADDVQRDADGAPYNTFGGFGAVSANNTSNLLLDYKEEHPDAYWRILELIFDPETGAGLTHLKVELGSDTNTSSGAEPATKRSADEPADVLRGAGFHLIADALTINPDIQTEVLRWGEPSWTGTDWASRYRWYKETIDAAYDTYGIELSYVSPAQNEIGGGSTDVARYRDEVAWTTQFAQWLERDARAADARYDYGDIKIVAVDSYRAGDAVARAILENPEALEQIDAFGYHYDIAGSANITRLNQEHGIEILYSEGVSPMIEPEYRVAAEPSRGGVGGTVGLADIADRFINAYSWSGSGEHPAHMTSFLFQPAVSAMYEGTQYLPKSLIRASDPWSGHYEGGAGIALVRQFMQFIGEDWEYVEGASGGDGTKGDGGTVVDTSTRTALTLRTPQAEVDAGARLELTQVQANNTAAVRNVEVKVAHAGTDADTPLHLWETRGPDVEGDVEHYDENYFQHLGTVVPVRTETVGGVEHHVYQVQVQPYSVLTLTTDRDGVHDSARDYVPGEYDAAAADTVLELPYADDFSYAGYPAAEVGGTSMSYTERRSGTPRYTADQNGAFEVVDSGDPERGAVLQQQIHAGNRGYTWDVWGSGRQDAVMTATPATVLGDHSWTNYTASTAFRLDTVTRDASLANFAGLGVRQVVVTGSDLAAYAVRVHESGAWELRRLGTVVASGSVFMFDPSAWHTLTVEARENVITASLDGETLGSYTDTTAGPVLSGRVALLSGIANTQYDDLSIAPIDGLSWHAEKIDDADARISYPAGFAFSQAGYAHLNRTLHVLSAGRSFVLTAAGTGFNLTGATGAARLSVVVDDQPAREVAVGATGDRQTSYWLRGLTDEEHTIRVTVVSGTYTLDGVDVLLGGDVPAPVDPEVKPVTVTGTIPRLATTTGTVPALPATLAATSEAGGAIDAPVTWSASAAQFRTDYALVKVDGTFDDNPSLTVSAYVEVVPAGVRYLVDANAPADGTAYPAVAALAGSSGTALLNAAADGAYSAGTGWGRAGTYSAKGRLNATPYDKASETGWYTSGTGTPIVYTLTLPAGEYRLTSGHHEWWNAGSGRSRVVTGTIAVPDGAGGSTSVATGSHTFANGSAGQSATLSGTFTLPVDGEVTYTVAGTGGTEAPALSWLGVATVSTEADVDRSALAAALAAASAVPSRAYTAGSWQALRAVAVAARAVHDDPAATQPAVDLAAADVTAALAALVEVPNLALSDYRLATEAGTVPALPSVVALRTVSGATQDVPVTWSRALGAADVAAGPAQIAVAGVAGSTPVTLHVEVLPDALVYLADSGREGADSFLHASASPGGRLLNPVPDQRWDGVSADRSWGWSTASTGAVALGSGVDWGSSYVPADYGKPVVYHLTLPAGEYELGITQAPRDVTTRLLSRVVLGGTEVSRVTATASGAAETLRHTVTVPEGGAVVDLELGTDGTSGYNARVALAYARALSEASITGIAVTSAPATVKYVVGSELDLTGLVVTATLSDGSTRVLSADEYTVSGYDPAVPGTQVVTVSSGGFDATFQVTVVEDGVEEPTVVGLAVTTPPGTTRYAVGDPLDLTGLVVTATLSDGSTREVPAGDLAVTGYDASVAGTQTVTVSWGGVDATFEVVVEAPATLTGLRVVSPPTRTAYTVGESLDLAGLVVESTWSDGSAAPVAVDALAVGGFDPVRAGTQTVVLTLVLDGVEVGASFEVTVAAAPGGGETPGGGTGGGPGGGSGGGSGGSTGPGRPDDGGTAGSTPAPPAASAADLATSPGVSGELSRERAAAGGSLTVTARGFAPGETVQVWVYSTPTFAGRATADASGAVSATVTLPAGLALGTHTVVLVGETSGRVLVAPFEVVTPAALARTGASGARRPVAAGAVLLLVGGGLVALRRWSVRAAG
ncbi:bacterial Ig-like domain-containing protein [Cellulomonas hominis]|uniref:bacterial Ig-like domain-containing protein n=1 Tax=Cellulomonas hominis TaxID=156981 RepID=UPI001C0F47E3|nr:bacterial Ig-like domain-containing protein [Cellulomonas hominis]MBU5423424.1 bacterial Ig-like domain-containing protein [Cellulomonas hominis]